MVNRGTSSHAICSSHRHAAELVCASLKSCVRDMQIAGNCPGPNLSRCDLQSRLFPHLLRGLKIARPNRVGAIDITYIRLAAGLAPAARILHERSSLELPSRAEGGRPCWAVIVVPKLAIQAQQRNRHSSHLLACGVIPCLSIIDLDAELVQTFQGSTHAD